MSRKQTKRARLEQGRRARRIMTTAFVAVLFVGLFVQIFMIARLAGQNKAIQAVETEIKHLSAEANNLNLALNQYRSTARVESQAKRLGMERPEGEQLRVVSVPEIIEDTSAQSAGLAGTGEMVP